MSKAKYNLHKWARYVFMSSFMLGLSISFTNCSKSSLEFNATELSSSSGSNSNSPSTTTSSAFESATILRLSGRTYAYNLLTNIFGPVGSVGGYSFAQYFIMQQINPFGEPCDMYEAAEYQGSTGSVVYDDANSMCGWPNNRSGILETLVPSIVSSGALREANRIQACQNVVVAPGAVATALAQIPGASLTVAPTTQTLGGAYSLFYPGQEASSDIIEDLSQLTDSLPAPVTDASKWQAVLLTLCLAPDWQIL